MSFSGLRATRWGLLRGRRREVADLFFFTVIIFGCLIYRAFLAVCMLSPLVYALVLVTLLDTAYCHINEDCYIAMPLLHW